MFGSLVSISRAARIVILVPLLGLLVSGCGVKTSRVTKNRPRPNGRMS